MAPKIDKAVASKNVPTSSPPKLRPRNRYPSTSTPKPTQSRKRKNSTPGDAGRTNRQKTEKLQNSKMMRTPDPNEKKKHFTLDPPVLQLSGDKNKRHSPPTQTENSQQEPAGSQFSMIENPTGAMIDIPDMSNDVLLQDTVFDDDNEADDDVMAIDGVPEQPIQEANKVEDPFAKLHACMNLNFSEIKADNQNIKSQLLSVQTDMRGFHSTINSLTTDVSGLNSRLNNVAAQAVSNKCGLATINKKLLEIHSKPPPEMEKKLPLQSQAN